MRFANDKSFVNDRSFANNRSGASLTAEQRGRQESRKAFWISFRTVVFNHPGLQAQAWYCLYCQRSDPAHFGRTINPKWNGSTRVEASCSDHHQQASASKGSFDSRRECRQQQRPPREAAKHSDERWRKSLRNY